MCRASPETRPACIRSELDSQALQAEPEGIGIAAERGRQSAPGYGASGLHLLLVLAQQGVVLLVRPLGECARIARLEFRPLYPAQVQEVAQIQGFVAVGAGGESVGQVTGGGMPADLPEGEGGQAADPAVGVPLREEPADFQESFVHQVIQCIECGGTVLIQDLQDQRLPGRLGGWGLC